MAALPQGAAEMVPQACGCVQVHDRVAGQERREVRRHADRPHARTAAAVGDAEGLVEVQVADVGADVARAAEPDLGVHVGAVHVHLPAVLVHDPADLPDRSLEDAVRATDRSPSAPRGCRDAPRPWPADRPGRCCPAASLLTATTCMPAITALAGLVPWADWGMRQVVRWAVAAGAVVGPDDQQARVFALGARVGLQRHRREAGDLRQLVLQLAEEQLVARGLVARARRDAAG